ncbi:hypothetical protein BX616_003565 [Lobosporangium transversale]|nr:hypothetical protein BX616_003565 [Lobosporangium transversale]
MSFLSTPRSMLLSVSIFLLASVILPIPVRPQPENGVQVRFPTSSLACNTCKPAFSTEACKKILDSIVRSSTVPISNKTLAECQCTGTFLSVYDMCVECFRETNQLTLMLGSDNPPSQASLSAYCSSMGPIDSTTTITTVTKTVTHTSTSTPTSTSSATSLKAYQEGQLVAGMTVMYTVVAVTAAMVYFSTML